MGVGNELEEIQMVNNENSKDGEVTFLDIDDILKKIGQFGTHQIFLVGLLCLLMVPVTFHSLIMAFIGNNPPWRCVMNNTQCNSTTGEVFDKNHEFYEARCSMDRSSWEYIKPQSFSIVTEVKEDVFKLLLNAKRRYSKPYFFFYYFHKRKLLYYIFFVIFLLVGSGL